jgi:hypothetical protein
MMLQSCQLQNGKGKKKGKWYHAANKFINMRMRTCVCAQTGNQKRKKILAQCVI